MRLLLASKSPARRATLVAAGVTPLVRVSDVDEGAVLAELPGGRAFSGGGTTPADEVSALARAKCEAVVAALIAEAGAPAPSEGEERDEAGLDGELLVVGCDSMLEIDGAMAGKPHVPEVAVERIRQMRGRSAVLWTGHHLVRLGAVSGQGRREVRGACTRAASTVVRFGEMSDAEIDAYVATGEPLHVAGSFTIDALGGPFVEGVDGDPHSVVGISLPLVRAMAADLGVFWPDLWDVRRVEG